MPPGSPGAPSLREQSTRHWSGSFPVVQQQLGLARLAVPARPKRTVFDAYFRAASVDGMTDPYFLETLTVSALLAVERPMTVAHEWAHLAGYADEGEANFVGWLICLGGDGWDRYSAWLFMYGEVISGLDGETRAQVSAALDKGPRADLAAVAQRVRSQANPVDLPGRLAL